MRSLLTNLYPLDAAVNAVNAHSSSADALTRLTGMSLDEAKKILDVEGKLAFNGTTATPESKTITMEDIEKVSLPSNCFADDLSEFIILNHHKSILKVLTQYPLLIYLLSY